MFFLSLHARVACLGICVFGIALVASTSVGAQEGARPRVFAEPTGDLTLARSVEAALTRNPDLVASRFELSIAEARIAQASVRPNPELSVELENFAGSGAARGARILESTLSLSQVIELGDKRSYRTDVATADRELAGVERQARQLDVLAEVTQRFIAVVSAQDQLQLATSTKELAQRTFDAIDGRVRAARSPEAERSRARIALTRASIEEHQMQTELLGARQSLSAMWGTLEPQFSQARADLLTLESIEPFDALVTRMASSPDLLRFASEARLRDAELRLARAQARPNLTFGLGVRRLSESNDAALVAGFSLPLAVFDRNQGGIREAEARRDQNAASHEAMFVRVRATVFALYQQLLSSRTRVETLSRDALIQAQQALDQTQYGYERGRFSYLELSTAQQELLELRAALIDAAADYHRILSEIERVTGEPVVTDAS